MAQAIPPFSPVLRLSRWFFVFAAFFSLGSALVSGGAALTVRGQRTDGVVVDIQRNRRSGKPVVEFSTADGQRRRFTGLTSSSPPSYRVGERVSVYYDPRQPDDVVLDTFSDTWMFPLALGLGAVGCLIAGAVNLATGLGRRRAAAEVMASGLRLPGRVASVEAAGDKKSKKYVLFIEAQVPPSGAVEQFVHGPLDEPRKVGSAAIVHVERDEPRRYFVEIA